MSSQTNSPGDQDESGRDNQCDSVADEPVRVICVVCQQPLETSESRRWRTEPVHPECGAELRCGVSIGNRPEK